MSFVDVVVVAVVAVVVSKGASEDSTLRSSSAETFASLFSSIDEYFDGDVVLIVLRAVVVGLETCGTRSSGFGKEVFVGDDGANEDGDDTEEEVETAFMIIVCPAFKRGRNFSRSSLVAFGRYSQFEPRV